MNHNKLNYLLVLPRLIQNMGDGYSFPLGIAYISASMKKAGFNVINVNLNHVEGEVSDILKELIDKHDIDVVATGGLSFQYNTVKLICDVAKSAKDDIITIVGGGIITGDAETAMEAVETIDFGCIGEGEITMNDLCSAIETGRDPATVDGIIYLKDGKYVRTSPRTEVANIDEIPWPDYEGFEVEKYLKSSSPGISGLNGKNTLFMLASRACPYNCTFCFHTVGKKYRQRSLDNFFEELDYMTSKYRIDFVCMADELFARDINRVREFCTRIKKYNVRWWGQFRVDDITQELLDILKDGGCEVMSFGLESADNRILKSMRKHTTVEQIERTLKLVSQSGIALEGAFIFGDIEETAETAANTLKWWREHIEYKINLNLITVYPGTYLYKYACENGIIKDKVQFLKDGCPQTNVSKMSDSEMSDLVKDIMEAPISITKPLHSVELKHADYHAGRIDFRATCDNCGHENYWDKVKLFATNFITCEKCGQKYNVPIPASLVENIEKNAMKLIEKYGDIGFWAVNFNTSFLFKEARTLQNEKLHLMDISEMKRVMVLYGKKIEHPRIVDELKMPVVVIMIPAFFSQISTQINSKYKHVERIIDICELTDPNFIP